MAPTPPSPPIMSSIDNKDIIHIAFRKEHRTLETLLDELLTAPTNERSPIIDRCLAGISRLSDLLKDATSYLPAYDQRSYSQKVKALSDQLVRNRQSLAPKKKFSFKSQRNNTAAIIGGALDIGPASTPTSFNTAVQKAATSGENITITAQTGAHIRPAALATPAGAASLLLSSLTRCVIALPATARFSSAAIKNVDRCVLLLGAAVNGPVHLTAVKNSMLVFSCRQFRMHDARNVDVYLHCSSRPIIEDCEDIRFHTYGADDDDGDGNMWDQVDDFKWLRSEKSPHWSASRGTAETDRIWRELATRNVGEIDVERVLSELLDGNAQ